MKVHGQRALLNKPGFSSTAAIVAEIEDTGDWKPGCDKEGRPLARTSSTWDILPEMNLVISDCSRTVTFDQPSADIESWNNSLSKIDIMIEALNSLREGIVIEKKRYSERKEIWDNRPKKKD